MTVGRLETVATALRRLEPILRAEEIRPEAARVLAQGTQFFLRPGYSIARRPDEEATWAEFAGRPRIPTRPGRPPALRLAAVEAAAPYLTIVEPADPPAESATETAGQPAGSDTALVVLDSGAESAQTPGIVALVAETLADAGLAVRLFATVDHEVFLAGPPEVVRRAFDLLRARSAPRPGERSRLRALSRTAGASALSTSGRAAGDPSGADLAREYLDRHLNIADCVAYGIVNTTALARRIAKEAGSRQVDAIEVALRRGRDSGRSGPSVEDRIIEVVLASRLEIRTPVALVSAPPAGERLARLLSLGAEVRPDRRRLFQVMQSPVGVTVLCENELVPPMLHALGAESHPSVRTDLAATIIHSPEEIGSTPGVLAFFARVIARAGINCVEMMSLGLESTFVVSQPDSIATFELLLGAMRRAPVG